MIRVGILTLVSSKVTKAIGEKDISEIIYGAGISVVGVNALMLIKPTIDLFTNMSGWFVKMGDKIEGILNIFPKGSVMDKIINFGAKTW
jgi:hypothetical protein